MHKNNIFLFTKSQAGKINFKMWIGLLPVTAALSTEASLLALRGLDIGGLSVKEVQKDYISANKCIPKESSWSRLLQVKVASDLSGIQNGPLGLKLIVWMPSGLFTEVVLKAGSHVLPLLVNLLYRWWHTKANAYRPIFLQKRWSAINMIKHCKRYKSLHDQVC